MFVKTSIQKDNILILAFNFKSIYHKSFSRRYRMDGPNHKLKIIDNNDMSLR